MVFAFVFIHSFEDRNGRIHRFFDAAAAVEYLHERVIEAVHKDLPEELAYVQVYDRVYHELTERFDGLPARKVSLLANLCLQNAGRLARGKRRLFAVLTDVEIADAERIVRQVLDDDPAASAVGSPASG